jgi:hypothetical protein
MDMIRIGAILAGVALALFLPCAASAQLPPPTQYPLPPQSITTQVIDVMTPPSPPTTPTVQMRVRYLLLSSSPTPPGGAAILFAGGNGLLSISDRGDITTNLANNFLVRMRTLFAQYGLAVAVVDAPNGTPTNALDRLSDDHARAMVAVINDVHTRIGKKVWLVGTSSGTLSVVNVAGKYPKVAATPAQIRAGIDPNFARPVGIVLTSSQSQVYNSGDPNITSCGSTIYHPSVMWSAINVPAYVVADQADACRCSPPSQNSVILNKLTASPQKASYTFADPNRSTVTDQCTALTPHGFYLIESQVVPNIVSWIGTHQ